MALLAVNLLASVAIYMAFAYMWGSLAFWAPRAAEEINSSTNALLMQLQQFPLDGAGSMLIGGLLTVLPVGFVGWYPARALLGLDPLAPAAFVTPLAALAFLALAAWFFGRGLQQYGRTGSTRYLSWGFRR